MNTEPNFFTIDTNDIPARDRTEYFREGLKDTIGRFFIDPLTETPMRQLFDIYNLPCVNFMTMFTSPVHCARQADEHGDEELTFNIMTAGDRPAVHSQLGRSVELRPGDVSLIAMYETSIYVSEESYVFDVLRLSRRELATRIADVEGSLARSGPDGRPAQRLLSQYLSVLKTTPVEVESDLAGTISSHLYDLVALTLKPSRDAVHDASRSIAAARAATIKRHVQQRLTNPALSVGSVAAAFGISDRYLRALFETDGGFWAYITRERLDLAVGMLTDPTMTEVKIIDIAYRSGFNSLSTFNRAFAGYYGCRPSSLR